MRRTSLVAARIASALLVMDRDGGSILVSRRYTLKTSSVGIIPLGPTISLIALTTICSVISLLIDLFFSSS